MKVLQVKEYHSQIAQEKENRALQRWKEQDNGYGYPIKTMFYFYRADEKGYPTTKRKKGYVAFTDRASAFGFTEEQAIEKLNR